MVLWVTGLAGAGKTTISRLIYADLSERLQNLIHLDGDELRKVFPDTYRYSPDDKMSLAMQYARLCQLLSNKQLFVICSTISMYHEVRAWNRENIADYFELYLKVPIDILIERDQNGLYSRALRGEVMDLIGINEEFEEPAHSDLEIVNDGSLQPRVLAASIVEELRRSWLEKGTTGIQVLQD